MYRQKSRLPQEERLEEKRLEEKRPEEERERSPDKQNAWKK
jgi:hypothetical protein